ncbi:hypothetical protein NLU13_6526 [Sarocladium strictum]|uniref:Uncharacterized protein n=1 Tax=Sarocladium strictum TaxID=5046 RepID=A0AA39GG18_SARSR|nr:hypothetical protein NLU13_6526 [Sarocladium strictum]
MGTVFDDRMSRIHDLELARQQRLHQTELIKRDEDARRLKLKTIALRDDNAALKDSLSQKESYYRQWIKQRDQLRAELDEARDMIRSHEARAKKQTLEMTSLRAEVDSLTTSMQDSGKALQEKFALARELNRLRPEMEHLQSQLTNYQAVVAEKHDLRRQVDSLEVELENEKRARQRTKAKNDDGEVEELRSQLQDVEKKLSTARKDKERMGREHEKAMAGVVERCEQLEEDQTASATKLKQTQADLKEARGQLKVLEQELEECRAELEEARTSAAIPTAHSVSIPTKAEAPAKATGAKARKTAKAAPEPSHKRRLEEVSLNDVSIGTPGNDGLIGRPPKKRGIEQTAGTEKSNFSITPFLNRNKGLDDVTLEDTPVAAKTSVDESSSKEPEVRAKATPKKVPATKAPKPRGRPPKAAASTLTETTSSKRNVAASQISPQKSRCIDESQALVPEEETGEQENALSPRKKAPQASKPKTATRSDTSSTKVQAQAESKATDGEKKKKRKFLGAGTTLFDEDDGEPIRPLAGPAVRRIKAPLAGGSNGFGAFSPLKRQKRGVGASFLA